jgi:hypothetical protein
MAVQIFIDINFARARREKQNAEVIKEEKLVAFASEDNIKEETGNATTDIEHTPLKKLYMNKYKKG